MSKRKKVEHVRLVWAFQELKELDKRVGFVTVEWDLAQKLLDSGKVQNPQIGANALKPIQYKKPKKQTITKDTPKEIVTKDTKGK